MDMTPDEREQLTDILFQLLNRTDAKTVRELAAGGPGTIFQMIQRSAECPPASVA